MPILLNLLLAVLLLLCLADMPYGYYTLVRFTFGALALLFQPFYKIALGRTVWNVVDVVVAAGLLYLMVKSFNKNIDKK